MAAWFGRVVAAQSPDVEEKIVIDSDLLRRKTVAKKFATDCPK